MTPREKRAIRLAVRFGGIDGDHHKAWVIDQMVRALAGAEYKRIVAEGCECLCTRGHGGIPTFHS